MMTSLYWVDMDSTQRVLNAKRVWNDEKNNEKDSKIFLKTCKTVSRKPCINREYKKRAIEF